MKTNDSEILFEERQWFQVWWLWLIVLGTAMLIWYGWISQILLGRPFGQRPAPDSAIWVLWITFGIALPAFFFFGSQDTVVARDRITIRSMFLYKRRIDIKNIDTAETRRYDPLREYGGWGIRFWVPRQREGLQCVRRSRSSIGF